MPVELDDLELLDWVKQRAGDAEAMQSARFRHGYERTWLTSDAAALRVLRARAEVLGARIATVAANVGLLVGMIVAASAAPPQAGALAAGLAAAGAVTLLWRGAGVLARAASLQAVAVAILAASEYGILAGLLAGFYVPPMVMAGATFCGARAGRAVADERHARLRRRLALDVSPARRTETENAVAA